MTIENGQWTIMEDFRLTKIYRHFAFNCGRDDFNIPSKGSEKLFRTHKRNRRVPEGVQRYAER